MNKTKTIAVDIDDVLADNATGFIAFSNQRWGTTLSVDDYIEHWAEMWGVDLAETERRAHEFHTSGTIGAYAGNEPAKTVLTELHKEFRLVIVTSRRRLIEKETIAWLEKHYAGLFDEIHFAGFWDTTDDSRHTMTKAEICQQIGADYLVDDQLKHVEAAAAAGLKAILFGSYSWNKTDKLRPGVTRCNTWNEVREYFDAAG